MTDRDAAAVEKAGRDLLGSRIFRMLAGDYRDEDVRAFFVNLRREWQAEWEREKLTVPCPTCKGEGFGEKHEDGMRDVQLVCQACGGPPGRVPIQYAAAMETIEFFSGPDNTEEIEAARDEARRRWLEGKE